MVASSDAQKVEMERIQSHRDGGEPPGNPLPLVRPRDASGEWTALIQGRAKADGRLETKERFPQGGVFRQHNDKGSRIQYQKYNKFIRVYHKS